MNSFDKEVVFFLLNHLFSGMAGAAVLGTGLLVCDVANLRTLMLDSDSGAIACVLLFVGLMTTLGGIAMAVGLMSIGLKSRYDE